MFFFEKSTKNFSSRAARLRHDVLRTKLSHRATPSASYAREAPGESFLLLFCKKEELPSFA